MKKVVLFVVIVCCYTQAFAEGPQLAIGYNYGGYLPAQKFLEISEYKFNLLRSHTEELQYKNNLQGFHVGTRYNFEDGFIELAFSTKKVTSTIGNFMDNNLLYDYQGKLRLRSFNIGAAGGGRIFRFGGSLDVGTIKFLEKNALEASFEEAEWNKIGETTLFSGVTIFTSINLMFLEIKPYVQSGFYLHSWEGNAIRSLNGGVNVNVLLGGWGI